MGLDGTERVSTPEQKAKRGTFEKKRKIKNPKGRAPRSETLKGGLLRKRKIREKEQRKEKRKRKNYGEFPVFKVTIYGAG